jgi:hypothetical protein
MADSPPDEDMDTSPEPSKVPEGSRDLKDQDESAEIETEDATLDLQPEDRGTEVFECPGNCDEFKPCGSDNCNALDGLHIKDDGEEEEGQGTHSWAKDDEEVVHTRSPIIPTSEADFIAWNRRIEHLRRQAIELHESEGKFMEIALRRRTPIEDLVWDGRKDTFCTVQGQQKIKMLSDTIVNPKTLNSIVAYIDFLLTRNQKSRCLSNLKLDMSFLSQGMEAFSSQGKEMPLNLRIRKEQASSFRF